MSFAHLHVHTEYSLLDGLSKIETLVARSVELNMPALAITDHGTMFGTIEFYSACKKAGVKPIIGVETYLAARGMRDRDHQEDRKSFHLLLLAKDDTGYRNLLRIATASQLEGFYYNPRIDRDFLAAHAEGLICTTGCMSGEIPRAIVEERMEEARRKLDWYYEVFGRDNFFFEVQQHDIPELAQVNRALLELGPRYNAQYVATNDVHYLRAEDAPLHDVLLCIQTGSLLSQEDRMRMSDGSFYLRSPEEMARLFGEVPGAIGNSLAIAERCSVDLDFKGYHLPPFDVPPGSTPEAYLRRLCEQGQAKRFPAASGEKQRAVRERLDYELGVIRTMGFDTYFLIVWDLCRFARERGIWFNARGSAAGSMVAYCLGITLVDPIEHGLIFERFLNPGRISMPDIDLDFQDDRRWELLEYTARKYGEDKVAQIITFGTMAARAAIRDVGRVMDIPLPEVDRIAKLIPAIPGKPITIRETLEQEQKFKEAFESADYVRNLIDTAAKLEGVARNAGTHAAGVIIADKPIIEYVPLHRPTKGTADTSSIKVVTQFEMSIVEGLGLLKVDFLGLAMLTVMARACALIEGRHGRKFDIHTIPTDDPKIYELLGKGDVAGIFQVEGAGLRRYLVEMKPTRLEHIIAMVALYRPGPIDFIPTYIKRMHGEEGIEYRHAALEPILKETYGITVYQESIMRTAMDLAGYTASEADELRRAVAKKKAGDLLAQRTHFVSGAVERGVPESAASSIFDDWEAFARYGFPKGHAADYGVICAQTAYLKAYYPVEYMAALLSVERSNADKVALYTAECRKMGIAILPPDVNRSGLDFTIEEQTGDPSSATRNTQYAIRFGLGAIKNVGESPVRAIMQARQAGGPFVDLEDFARRVDLRRVQRRALECLIKVGALSAFGPRQAMLDHIERIIGVSAAHHRAREIGQMSLFGAATGVRDTVGLPRASTSPPPVGGREAGKQVGTPGGRGVGEAPRKEILAWEKELVGVYVTDHPLAPVMTDIESIVTAYSAQLGEEQNGQRVTLAGIVTHIRRHQTKKGDPMAYVTLEDLQGAIELLLFPKLWKEAGPWLAQEQIVVVTGRVDAKGSEAKIIADAIGREITAAHPPADPSHPRPQARATQAPRPPSGWGNAIPAQRRPAASASAAFIGASSPETWDDAPPPDLWDEFAPPADDDRRAGAGNGNSAARPGQGGGGGDRPLPAAPAPATRAPRRGVSAASPSAVRYAPPPAADLALAVRDSPGEYRGRAAAAAGPSSPSLAHRGTDGESCCVVVTIEPTGDADQDKRRLRRVHGLLTSYPGHDRFTLVVHERQRWRELDFPNDTTGYCPALAKQLQELLGPDAVATRPP